MNRLPVLAVAFLVASPTLAAPAPPPPSAAAWAALPDWSGVWQMVGNTVFDHDTVEPKNGAAGLPGVREHPPYKPDWEARYQANIALVAKDRFPDPFTTCGVPVNMPRMLNLPDTHQFAIRPGQVWHITENGSTARRIYTDGRPHLSGDDLFPTYTGDNIGHWEGDTLVVDTIGLRDDMIIDRTGLIHSGELHVVQRMRKLDDATLEVKMTLEDPVAFTGPWHVTKRFTRLPKGTWVFDYACAENNRNPITPEGKTLTRGSDGKPIDIER